MKKRHHRRHKKNDEILKIIAVILAIIILVCGILFAISLWEKHTSQFNDTDGSAQVNAALEFEGQKYDLNKDVETFLVMGLDKFEHADDESYSNDMQADFLMLFVIDNKKEEVSALHINRDTIAQMSVLGVAGDRIDTINQQIALAHTYGNGKEISCRNTLEAVSDMLLNIDIDHYASVTMDAVEVYNDLVGGVKVTVLDDFNGIDDSLVKGEEVTLHGEHALNYVRTRYGLKDSSNNKRMARQRQYIQALYEKSRVCIEENDDFIVNAAAKLSAYMVSDCSGNRLQVIAEKIADYEFVGIKDIKGETVKGETYIEFYPDAKSVKKTVLDLFYVPVG